MRSAILIALAAAMAAPAAAAAPEHGDGEAQLQKLLEGRVAGRPVSCVSFPQLGSSQIVEGTAIVYGSGSRLYVNRPRSGAETLRSDDILVTKVNGGNLCSIDSVNLVDRGSQMQRGFVILGDFVPYTRAPKAE